MRRLIDEGSEKLERSIWVLDESRDRHRQQDGSHDMGHRDEKGGIPGESGRLRSTARLGTEFVKGISPEADSSEFRDRLWCNRSNGRLRENHLPTADR